MSSSGDGLSEPPPGTSPPSAPGEQPVPSVSEPSSETTDHVMVSTEIADTEQARSATIGHAVASTDLPMHTPDTHVPTTDVDISTVSGHSTGCEFSSDELLASDVDMRSSTDPDQPNSSPMQTSSVSASSAGSQQSSLDQPLLGSATEAPSGSRFRAGWQTDTTQLSFAQSFEDSQKPTTSTEGFSSRVQDPSMRPQPPRGTSRRPARATTTAPLPRRGTSTTRGARGQRRLLRSRSCVAGKPSSSKTQELPEDTPEGFWHYLIDRHPWAEYVKPRQLRMHEIASQQVTNELSEDIYRPVPTPGYLKLKFVRSLFPRVTPINGLVTASLPFLELPSLEDAVVFRGNADNIIQAALRGHVQPEPQPPEGRQAAKGAWTSVVAPRYLKGLRPVIYQVVAVKSNSLVLEAKDFFIFMPDRLELHCILLDKFAFNVKSERYGHDRTLVSIKDFIWVYDLMPVAAALSSPAAELARARIPRTAALEANSTYFFRVARFAFVTPPVWTEPRYGMVVSLTRRGAYLNNFRMAIEGSPEAVTIARSLCRFDWPNVNEYEILRALCRRNSSCAVRFSEPPASQWARDTLCRLVKNFLPANPGEAMVPMEVYKVDPNESRWFEDRLHNFDSFAADRQDATMRMGRIFNAASSALAAYVSMDDDKETHRVTAIVPSLSAYPLRIEFLLSGMSTEAGWSRHRPVDVWIMGAFFFVRMTVEAVIHVRETRQLRIQLRAYPWSHRSLLRATNHVGRLAGNSAFLEVCVKLGKLSSSTIPAYEAVTHMRLFSDIPTGSMAHKIMDAVYGLTLGCLNEDEKHLWPLARCIVNALSISISLHGRTIQFTEDQCQACAIGVAAFPICGIQAAYGTGKTVVGATIAITEACSNQFIIVTATTNAAVAQFTETLLGLERSQDIVICRYVAETVAFDESIPTTAADLHELLKALPDMEETLSDEELLICQRFRDGRIRYEEFMRNRECAMNLTEQEREEFLLAETDVSELIDKVVSILFTKATPRIVAITTSSLLNATGKNVFAGLLDRYALLKSDEASQVPEPVYAAMMSRLPKVRHIYIGDVHQLEPYARCSRNSNPVKFGARSVMDVLSEARAVPMAPLVTTFRAHPNLNGLPNPLAYSGALRSGVRDDQRRMLLNIMRFPNDQLPFLFIDVAGTSQKAQSHSHFNEAEAEVCTGLIDRLMRRGVPAASICIITFYKEQHRRLADFAQSQGIDLSTVDAVQGREKDVVVLLTTKTDFDPNASEFLEDPRRMNVALTRCRHGQFVLGHQRSLLAVPFWNTVISWARANNAIVSATALRKVFP